MTDAAPGVTPPEGPPVGASKIINAPLTDPAVAAQRMADLAADPKFMEKVAAKDAEAFSEYNKAWRVAHGLPAEPEPPHSPVEIDTERDARVIAVMQQHAGFYRDRGYTEQQQVEIVGQRPVTMEEKRWHQTQYDMKKSSPAFMARWSAGDLEAIKEMNNHAIAMRLPTGTLADIERWENG